MLLVSFVIFANETPAWVKAKPSSDFYYTGIGSALLSADNYQQQSKEIALRDLISDIKIEIESNSIYTRQEIGNNYSENFIEEIKANAYADLEGYELVETWNDGTNYWSYYQLDKKVYEEIMAKRISDATARAYDYLTKAHAAKRQGDLTAVAQFCDKGLDAIEKFSYKRLPHQQPDGSIIDVAIELQNLIFTLFNGIAFQTNPETLEVEPFSETTHRVNIGLFCEDTPIRNVKLNAYFSKGSGRVNIPTCTNNEGITTMVISNISSKDSFQEITISINIDAFGDTDNRYMKTFIYNTKSTLPSITLPMVVTAPTFKAFVTSTDAGSNKALMNAVSNHLTQNNFDKVESEYDADVKVIVSSSIEIGDIVKGDLYDFIESMASCNIEVIDLRKKSTISSFGVSDIKSLSKANSSKSKIRNDAMRNMIRKLTPKMKRELTNMVISQPPKASTITPTSTVNTDTNHTDTSLPDDIK